MSAAQRWQKLRRFGLGWERLYTRRVLSARTLLGPDLDLALLLKGEIGHARVPQGDFTHDSAAFRLVKLLGEQPGLLGASCPMRRGKVVSHGFQHLKLMGISKVHACAEALLHQLKSSLVLHVVERDRLRKALGRQIG